MALRFSSSTVTFRLMVVTLLISYLFQSWHLGPVTLKVFPILFLFGLMMVFVCAGRPLGHKNFKQGGFWVCWGTFLIWKLVAAIANGSDMADFARVFLGADCICFMFTLTLLYFVDSREKVSVLAWLLTGMTLLSCAVGLCQWLDMPWAWDITKVVNPSLEMTYELISQQFLIVGLAGYAFTLGYFLSGIALFIFPFLFYGKKNMIWIYGSFVVIMFTLVILQERAPLVAVFAGAVLFLLNLRLTARSITALLTFGAVAFIGCCVGAGLLYQGRYVIDRFSQLDDPHRLHLFDAAFQYASQSFLFGIAPERFMREVYVGVAPHNFFINAYLYYGFIGFIFAAGMMIYLVSLVIIAVRRSFREEDPLLAGVALALLAQLINCMFHNASFVTSDFFSWWLIALLMICLNSSKEGVKTAV